MDACTLYGAPNGETDIAELGLATCQWLLDDRLHIWVVDKHEKTNHVIWLFTGHFKEIIYCIKYSPRLNNLSGRFLSPHTKLPFGNPH